MKLRTGTVELSDGRTLTVTQENWDISMRLADEQRKALADPLEDTRKQYFREKLYPVLFASSSGDVPSLDQAYAMLDSLQQEKDLNSWYRAVQDVNPDWFTYLNHNDDEVVKFSDGSKLTVHDGNTPAGIMRIRDLEEAATQSPIDDLNKQVFRATFYPKLAACSTGDVPDEEAARTMPTVETNKWYEAVNRVNPHWFAALHELKAEVDKEQLKKKRRKRIR
jgi:hypothetical protein